MLTDWFARNPATSIFRTFFAMIDRVVYALMSFLYQIFFAIAGVDFLGGEIVRSIYSRVQLILGVFMIFKLAVSILQGIVSPDAVLDKKRGMGNILTRIIVSLLMLSLMAPINIASPSNEWEKQVNDNGLLFGTLFSLQNRVLSNNTIGRLILGSNAADEVTSSNNLGEVGSLFSNTVLKAFVTINVLPDSTTRVCPNIDSSILDVYNSTKSTPGQILSLVNIGCERAANGTSVGTLFSEAIQEFIGAEQYAFSYFLIASTITGIIIDIVLIGYSVDVAIRVFKLAILRLIAPVPIIAHMNISAKEGKGEDAFSAWTRSLISTYLDLFIRLAVIYFVLFIIQAILVNGINLTNYNASGAVNVFAGIFIIIGLMFFARQAPKYIKSVLGIKPGAASVGMTALSTITGNVLGGNTKPGKVFDAVQENVAVRSFGDKDNKGKSFITQTKDAAVKKLDDKYMSGLQQAYYERGLDIGHNAVNERLAAANASTNKKPWWDHQDNIIVKAIDKGGSLAEANAKQAVLKENQSYYNKHMEPERAVGRGITVRNGYTAKRDMTNNESGPTRLEQTAEKIKNAGQAPTSPPPNNTPKT